ncbi:MAG: acyltransferase family protein [Clostridia bacterium]|nr:acyltransferase family protein [Clostridia bacterium]
MQNTRVNYIDISKGLGMFAVVWGHIMIKGATCSLVYGFDIPLFFFLSGLVYKPDKYKTIGSFAKSRFKNLLIPYIIYFILTFVIWLAYCLATHYDGGNYLKIFSEIIFSHGSGEFIPQNPPLWFVPCLFVVETIYFIIQKTNDITKIVVAFICAVLGYIMIIPNSFFDFKSNLPWSIEGAFRALAFYVAGNLVSTKMGLNGVYNQIQNKAKASTVIMVLSALIFIPLAIFNGEVSVGSNIYGKSNILFYLNGFIGTLLFIIISCKIEAINKNHKSKAIDYVTWVGKNSFRFMALHYPIHVVANLITIKSGNIFGYDFLQNDFSYYVLSIISFVMTVIATSIAVLLICKIKNLKNKKA